MSEWARGLVISSLIAFAVGLVGGGLGGLALFVLVHGGQP